MSLHTGRFPFTQNFRKFRWKFRWKFSSGEKHVPFNSGPFAAQWLRFYAPKFKNVAVNSLEVVRPSKSCKWNTHFHRKVSNGKTGLPFQKFHLFRKFSSGTNRKRVFHLHPNRNFRNFLVNGNAHCDLLVFVFCFIFYFRFDFILTFFLWTLHSIKFKIDSVKYCTWLQIIIIIIIIIIYSFLVRISTWLWSDAHS